ncbi:hypothetical protein [Haliangium ochraceum]|uniref:Uncharacterized protein n=1 Tax=Haliangium ochraceum (strain DSM 14365 / JCM 11303 / SMP-2) TaxID=502025 RepID=D0LU23_HALO1|nr:hypothetical protein [Haliangium ochraceum]ACY17387.1 hypothetical protein Hoch_4898 [Haliangium ochraceum DSM 14365]
MLLVFLCGCFFQTGGPRTYEYRLTWVCGMDICERSDEVVRYDSAQIRNGELELSSTVDDALFTDGLVATSGMLNADCRLVFGLVMFGHPLDEPMLCFTANGFELTVSIPNEDGETSSTWVIMARER